MEKLKIKEISFVGHSQGCLVGLEFASHFPKLIKSLVLVAGSYELPVNPALINYADGGDMKSVELMMKWGYEGVKKFIGGNPVQKIINSPRQVQEGLAVDLRACNNYKNGLKNTSNVKCPTLCILGDKDKMVFVSSSFFEVYGLNGDCRIDPNDGLSKWKSTTLGLNPNKMDQYNEVALWNDPQNAVVVYPYFTFAAYQPQGFYDYFKGNCDDCTTTKFVQPKSQYTSSGKAHQALTLLGYYSITDVEIDKNPSILQQFDKVIMLHNEYVTRAMFDAITSHPNVIYLYPNALYAEIEVNYIDETITLIRGHNYPEQKYQTALIGSLITHTHTNMIICVQIWNFTKLKTVG